MNTLNLLRNKLKLIADYCGNGLSDRALRGMADINRTLSDAAGFIIGCKHNKSAGPDEMAFLGSLQLVLEAMQKKDMQGLSAAVCEGLIPELERAERGGLVFDKTYSNPDNDFRLSEEERLFMSSTPSVVCLFGYGDGAYYEELCGKAPEGSTFIVFEPETDSILDLREELVKQIDFYRLDNTVVLATPGYDTIFATEYADFVHEINANRERILVNKNTMKRFQDNASRNVITNLYILEKCNLLNDLTSILPRDIPVIIVSAGPSLDKNIEMLKKAKGHSLIFAVDTAMKYLMQHDIMPDLGITVEPIKPMANYEDDRCFDVPHVFDCESNPEIVSRERGRIFIYNCRDYVKRLLESTGTEVPADVPSGGSVATAAFAICYQLQVKTIILIGQDLAYAGTSTHAGGVESAGINGDIGTVMVDGVDGEPVRTRSDWMGYLRWFENSIKTINEQKLDMTVIDATEGGALIHGSHVMTLADAIDKYCAGCDYDFAEELKKLPYLLDENEWTEIQGKISDSFDELKAVKDAALKAAAICDGIGTTVTANEKQQLSECRSICENALLYPLINNYAVSDIADEVNRLRREDHSALSEIRQQKLAFDAIAKACDYFEKLRPE